MENTQNHQKLRIQCDHEKAGSDCSAIQRRGIYPNLERTKEGFSETVVPEFLVNSNLGVWQALSNGEETQQEEPEHAGTFQELTVEP